MLAFDLAIHRSQIKPQLPQMLRFELATLEFDHHIAAQLEVVEQQVDEKLVTAHIQQHLPPDEREARAQFQQEFGDMLHQGVFDLALLRLVGQAQKIETIGVFQRFVGQVGLRPGQADLKVGHRRAAALQQPGFDLHHQHIARPVVLNGLGRIPAAGIGVGQLVQQRQLVIPGQLCKHRLHKLRIRPCLGKSAHVLQIAGRKPLHVGKGGAQILRQPLDHLGAPPLACLPRQNVAPDLPVQQHQLAVDRQRGALLGGVDAALEIGQPVGIPGGRRGQANRLVAHVFFPLIAPSPRLRGEGWGEGRLAAAAVILV